MKCESGKSSEKYSVLGRLMFSEGDDSGTCEFNQESPPRGAMSHGLLGWPLDFLSGTQEQGNIAVETHPALSSLRWQSDL